VHIHPVHHRLHVRRGPGASRRAGRGHAHACGTMHAAPTAIARWDGRGAHVLRSPGGPAALARRWRRRAAHPLHVNCACTASGTPSTVVAVRTSSASRPHTAARVMAVLRFGARAAAGALAVAAAPAGMEVLGSEVRTVGVLTTYHRTGRQLPGARLAAPRGLTSRTMVQHPALSRQLCSCGNCLM
jgi:hypothetical protein